MMACCRSLICGKQDTTWRGYTAAGKWHACTSSSSRPPSASAGIFQQQRKSTYLRIAMDLRNGSRCGATTGDDNHDAEAGASLPRRTRYPYRDRGPSLTWKRPALHPLNFKLLVVKGWTRSVSTLDQPQRISCDDQCAKDGPTRGGEIGPLAPMIR